MTRNLYPTAALLLGLAMAAVSPAAVPAQQTEAGLIEMASRQQAERHEILLAHGIDTTPTAMMAFLREGFSADIESRGLPQAPRNKTDVVNRTVEELGFQRVSEAVPMLTAIVDNEFPTGAAAVIRRDVENLPLNDADAREVDFRTLVRLNAIVALGLIGDPSAAGAVSRAMQRETGAGFVTEGAIALGLMDDPAGLPALVTLAKSAPAEYLEGIYGAVFILTGRNYGVTSQTAPARQRTVQAELAAWSQANTATLPLGRGEILRRRAVGYTVPAAPLETLRGALKASRDPRSYDARYAANLRLRTLVPGSVDEVRAIAEDETEDTDVRWAAMEWFAATQPREARKVLGRIADRDEVVALRDRARFLLEDVRKSLAQEKRP